MRWPMLVSTGVATIGGVRTPTNINDIMILLNENYMVAVLTEIFRRFLRSSKKPESDVDQTEQ